LPDGADEAEALTEIVELDAHIFDVLLSVSAAMGFVQGVIQEIVATHPALLVELFDVNLKVRHPSALVEITENGACGVPQYLTSFVLAAPAVLLYHTSK
jgi:hypothetical protein